jgi:hypothetical protein
LLDLAPEAALSHRKGSLALRLRLGLDQVGETLRFGQVDAAILKGPAGELARLGKTQSFYLFQRRKNRVHDGTAAMALEFHDILACCACWTVKAKNQRLVEHATLPVAKQPDGSLPRIRQRTGEAPASVMRIRPADTDDAHCGRRAAAR